VGTGFPSGAEGGLLSGARGGLPGCAGEAGRGLDEDIELRIL